MSSFWWYPNAFDELVEKATSELLPAGQVDLALHLEISDQIRSKRVSSKDAMRSLKQRLSHKNPNVILATLSLVDICVKNSGSGFVKEVATREFMEEMTHLLKVPTGCNQDVKDKVLYLIQVWGIASKGNNSLSYISGTYDLLRAEGYVFPPVTERIDFTLLEAAVAPEWTDSDCCERCRTTFTLTTRKHHCRQCGGTFCQQCSSKSLPLPHLGINDTVRVCDGCYIKVKLSKVADKEAVPHLLKTPASVSSSLMPTYTPSVKSKNTKDVIMTSHSDDHQFEDDLQKAIELSLQESQLKAPKKLNRKTVGEVEEEANLAAAIAASLEDIHVSQETALPKYNKDNISCVDMENIQMFSTLMHRIQSAGGDVSNDTQINTLYTQIGALQPKLIKSLDETSKKHKIFVDLHAKLNSAVKAYDKLIQDRLDQQRNRTTSPMPLQSYPSMNNYLPYSVQQNYPIQSQQSYVPPSPAPYYQQQTSMPSTPGYPPYVNQQAPSQYQQAPQQVPSQQQTPLQQQAPAQQAPAQQAPAQQAPAQQAPAQQAQQQFYTPPIYTSPIENNYYNQPPFNHTQQPTYNKQPVEEAPLIDL
ncbi:Vacuolar protein-sorting-associated protein 27 [Rhizopus stolonifer]|uniref:Vacuolar protein sorting-associated protein 27 n=1 Tax=Rhizopus stolonifer TaxID=4846 RepID=A0A367K5H2_RHIST|nr:Vacuolar protein-sorting-associated protein 27 [Rhizopus stolonifer]